MVWFEHRHTLSDISTTLVVALSLLTLLFFLLLIAQTYILVLIYRLLRTESEKPESKKKRI
ncbi:Uu.00g017630.m01.CDS01 [Anthostomella pinea]|uniref:Uu.00g017630.m01.CDS01 n=1 Tax=Anthostomella pinea TaxID=933095 RepID=A0AAI8VYX3_9PEZI|nr:Uu.00g017630.m01.CDS01 [Anthostomella pinea]